MYRYSVLKRVSNKSKLQYHAMPIPARDDPVLNCFMIVSTSSYPFAFPYYYTRSVLQAAYFATFSAAAGSCTSSHRRAPGLPGLLGHNLLKDWFVHLRAKTHLHKQPP